MVSIGSVLGSRIALKPKRRDDWISTPNLFGAGVGDPSTKKTPAMGKGLRFLDRLEADENRALESRQLEYEADLATHKAREAAIGANMKKAAAAKGKAKGEGEVAMQEARDELKRLVPPEEPRPRRFRTNDSTVPKLGDLLANSPAGLLVYRDELMGLLSAWDREENEGDRAFYLEGWNGTGSYSIDRIGRGSQFIESMCLSVYGGIQPDLLGRYLMNLVRAMDNDGRIQRFQMMVFPDPVEWAWIDRYEKLFCAVALILHLAEGRLGPVQADTALRACAWTECLAGHARRVYGLLEAARITAAQTLSRRLAEGKLADGFTARDVSRKGWTGLALTADAESALDVLEEFHHVRHTDSMEGQPGRPTVRYSVNPAFKRVNQ